MSDLPPRVDVLVVGMGPSGATAGAALAAGGVSVLMISDQDGPIRVARAHYVSPRAGEVFRRLGVFEELADHSPPWEALGDMSFCTSLRGTELGRIQIWGTADRAVGAYRRTSPCPVMDVPQTQVETSLVSRAARGGAQTRYRARLLDWTEEPDRVVATVADLATGTEQQVVCRYLIGADGARSTIGARVGLDVAGSPSTTGNVYARFTADLTPYVQDRPSVFHWMLQPTHDGSDMGMMMLKCRRPWTEWTAGWAYDASAGEPDVRQETLRRRIGAILGDDSLEVEITGHSTWLVNQEYARTLGRGRVWCVGDAIHRHPPSGGLGSNTSVQDALNLAWKVAYVVRGLADTSLLTSYQSERAPVARQIVARANSTRADYARLRACFVDAAAEQGISVADAVDLLTDGSPAGSRLRERVHAAIALKDLELNAIAFESHQVYRSDAVVGDGPPEPLAEDPAGGVTVAPESTAPGHRLPHCLVVDHRGRRVSTLDLLALDAHTLITGPSGRTWTQAVQDLDLPHLRVVVIDGPHCRDLYGYWAQIRGTTEAGAVLVRPDGFVAWRASAAPADPEQARASIVQALITLGLRAG